MFQSPVKTIRYFYNSALLELNLKPTSMKYLLSLFLFFIISFSTNAQIGEPNFVIPPYTIAPAMTTADINGDGRLDLIARADDPGPDYRLIYFESYGDKDYLGPKVLLSHEYDFFSDFFVEDFNEDGFIDVLSRDSGTPRLYLGAEGGAFVETGMDMSYLVGNSYSYADHDGDGDKDLLAMANSQLHLFFYEGAPNYFSDNTHLIPGEFNTQVYHLADLNADGHTDVLYYDEEELTVRIGSSIGDYIALTIDSAPNTEIIRIAVADVDADGFNDLLTLSGDDNLIGWYRSLDNNWNFAPFEILIERPGIERFYFENLDDDAELEVLVHYNNSTSDRGLDRYDLENGIFNEEETVYSGFIKVKSVTIYDADSDGDLDIAASHDLEVNTYNSRIILMENTDDSENFAMAEYLYSRVSEEVLVPLDMDGDTDDDLFTIIDGRIWYAENLDGQGNHGAWKRLSTTIADDLYNTDYDGDGDIDLIVGRWSTGQYRLFENINDGELASSSSIILNASGLYGLKIIDFDFDGDKDFVYSETEQVYWRENLGTSFADPQQLTNMEDPYYFNFSLSDFDNDGDYDILVTDNDEITYNANNEGVFVNSTVLYSGEFEVWTEVYNVQTFDFDQDGDGDLVFLTDDDVPGNSEMLHIMQNIGTNETPVFEEEVNTFYYGLGNYLIEDFNYDGLQDIILVNAYGVYIMVNNAGTLLEAELVYDADVFNLPITSPVAIMGDANADGSADLYTAGVFARGNPVWFGNLNDLITISGITYADNNANNEYDDGDTPLVNQKITIEPDGRSTFSNASGQYGFIVESGTYVLEAESAAPWTVSTGTSAELTVPATVFTHDFGYQADSELTEGEVFIYSGPSRCGFAVPFWVSCTNTGTQTANGTVSLNLDANTSFVNALIAPDEMTETMLTWNFTDLEPSASLSFPVTLEMPGVDLIGTELNFSTTLNLTAVVDGTTDIATETYNPILNCAYDPNDKQVSPARALTTDLNENYTLHTEDLSYTVRFQNTGTDTAFTVVIRDLLSEHLDLTTIEPTSASHPYTLDIDHEGQAAFTFNNILLPDSLTNELESHGYIAFTISPKSDLPDFTIVDNTAEIYFDFNPPIITNTVRNIFVSEIPLAPVSGFDFDVDGFSVQFTDQSQNEPQTWYWDFDDGTFDTTQNPMHQFEELGNHDVCLTTQNDFGSNTACQMVNIETSSVTSIDAEYYDVIPNPTEGKTELYLKSEFGVTARLHFFDMKGVEFSLPVTRSTNGFLFDVTDITSGLYFFQLIDGEKSLAGKFVVSKE